MTVQNLQELLPEEEEDKIYRFFVPSTEEETR
jgi:hypothetical protein